MIPETITSYLENQGVRYEVRAHERAIGAPRLAEELGISGHRVAKALLVAAGQERVLVVLPATAHLDLQSVARVCGLRPVQLAPEEELLQRFPGCEVGAAPPFGRLWEVPVVVDVLLARPGTIWFRGGTHEDAIGLDYVDYADLEDPLVASVSYEGEELTGGELQGSWQLDAF